MTEPFPLKDNEFVAWYPLGLSAEQVGEVWRPKRAGYYVHIPYCTAICDYCGFAVEKVKGAPTGAYVEAVKTEIQRYVRAGRLSRHQFVCGHFGGGTPSAIAAEDLVSIKATIDGACDVVEDAEVTVEVNPISFTLEKAQIYRRAGVNRISFGVQSFDNRMLSIIGRPHRSSDVEATLEVIRRAGFKNYSIDLIYGVPGQELDGLKEDLERAADSGATHISCFRLEIIPLTALKLREAANLLPPRQSIEMLNEMDKVVSRTLTSAGYRWYGAFNFAKPGFESVHNAVAFMAPQAEYVGFGNSAYSFIGDHIYCNHADIHDYMTAVFAGEDPIALASDVTALESMARYFILGLKFFHVSRTAFIHKYGLQPEDVFGSVIADLKGKGVLIIEGDDYVLTDRGRPYVNNVVKAFFGGRNVGRSQYPQFISNLSVEQILKYADLREKTLQASP